MVANAPSSSCRARELSTGDEDDAVELWPTISYSSPVRTRGLSVCLEGFSRCIDDT